MKPIESLPDFNWHSLVYDISVKTRDEFPEGTDLYDTFNAQATRFKAHLDLYRHKFEVKPKKIKKGKK